MARLFTYSLDGIKPIIWQGQPAHVQWPKLRNYLRQQLGEDLAEIFAEPHVPAGKGSGLKGEWIASRLGAAAISLADLSPDELSTVRPGIDAILNRIKGFAESRLSQADSAQRNWGSLLLQCLKIPGDECILVEGDRFVLIGWGFESIDASQSRSRPIGARYPSSGQSTSASALRVSDSDMFKEESSAETVAQSPDSPEYPLSNSSQIPENAAASHSAAATGDTQNANVPLPTNLATPPPPIPVGAKRGWHMPKYWWWLLALLLLAVLLFFFLRGCTGHGRLLPDKAGILVPVDSASIGLDSLEVRYIAVDRLNVLLTDSAKDPMEFAKAFKQAFPGDQYQIIYYDTNKLTRLQLQVPRGERDNIRRALNAKLPAFKMRVYEESIYQQNFTPSDPAFHDAALRWHLDHIRAQPAWDATLGSENVIIAVIDDGFDLNHPELAGRIVKPWNVPANSSAVSTYGHLSHGTHVAGLAIGRADNNSGLAGVAPRCTLMPVQIGNMRGAMSTSAVIEGLIYAYENGADVINMSLGMAFSPRMTSLPPALQEDYIHNSFIDEEILWNQLFDNAEAAGATVVLAAGNSDVLIGLDPMQRSEKAIKVTATDQADSKASFSNYGGLADVSAPGVQIFSSVPGGRFAQMDGTSMASPIVAGAVGLLKSVNPALTTSRIKEILQTTGIPVSSSDPVGPLIQLDRALALAGTGNSSGPVPCPDIQREIDSLLRRIEELRRSCGSAAAPGDTLRIPPGATDPSFAAGRWKSTSTLVSSITGDDITLYFDLKTNGTGTLTLVGNDLRCTAPLKVSVNGGDLYIEQTEATECTPNNHQFSAYKFVCKPDPNNSAECQAMNLSKRQRVLDFNLVKINYP